MLISDWSSDVGSSDLTKVDLHLEQLWSRNVTITTRLVDTVSTPMLLKTVEAKRLQPEQLVTHRFALDDILVAYETFSNAAASQALKVVIATRSEEHTSELQSLMCISYAVFCLNKKNTN